MDWSLIGSLVLGLLLIAALSPYVYISVKTIQCPWLRDETKEPGKYCIACRGLRLPWKY